ncbi:MAG: TolC family protein [Deltaproteobacteria bacterium]|nr:TolC family protein [Deltaproteobacteria bacterium]
MRTIIGIFSILLILIFSSLASLPAFSEEALTLKSLIEEAKANNPELKAFSEKVRARQARAKAEGYLDDPTLKVEMEDLDRTRPLNTGPGNAMLTRYTVSQMFPFPGKLSLREKIALKEAHQANSELAAKEIEVSGMVKEAYYEYAYLNEAIRKTEEIKDVLTHMSEIAQLRYSTGQVSQQDVIKINVELTMLGNELISLNAEKEIAEARLKSLISRPQGSQVSISAELPKDRVSFNTDELVESAVKQSPDIRMMEAEAHANELSVDLAKKNYYPDLMVGVAPIQRDGRFDSYDLMFQINIPIWRGKYNSQTQEATANALFLKSRLASEKNNKAFEVKGAALQVDASDRMRSLYETSLMPQVELSFESAVRNYQTGRIDFIMLLDTERELKKTRIDYLRTLLEYRKRVAALERAVGVDISATSADGGLASLSDK